MDHSPRLISPACMRAARLRKKSRCSARCFAGVRMCSRGTGASRPLSAMKDGCRGERATILLEHSYAGANISLRGLKKSGANWNS